ncbi:MAG: hypothetical protein IPJ81_13355 [Chitinophagaceae bacterium]|nr:hypothetical protein [Chitinophagaceae bacterium]
MKKNILLLFFTVSTLCTNAQKLTQENIPGTWQTQSITSPSGIYYNVEKDSLLLPPAMLSFFKKRRYGQFRCK